MLEFGRATKFQLVPEDGLPLHSTSYTTINLCSESTTISSSQLPIRLCQHPSIEHTNQPFEDKEKEKLRNIITIADLIKQNPQRYKDSSGWFHFATRGDYKSIQVSQSAIKKWKEMTFFFSEDLMWPLVLLLTGDDYERSVLNEIGHRCRLLDGESATFSFLTNLRSLRPSDALLSNELSVKHAACQTLSCFS